MGDDGRTAPAGSRIRNCLPRQDQTARRGTTTRGEAKASPRVHPELCRLRGRRKGTACEQTGLTGV